jgi:ankyrin repeat protein
LLSTSFTTPTIAIDAQTVNGATALMFASWNGHDAVVQLLLSHTDISINAVDDQKS